MVEIYVCPHKNPKFDLKKLWVVPRWGRTRVRSGDDF